jgi:serine/threonine protein kinase
MILHSVGSALQFLRQHLDVKLDNILVELQDDSRGGRTLRKCVLADFGTARSLPPSLKAAAVIDSLGRELTPHWGNDSHICPELHSALASAMMQRQVFSRTTFHRQRRVPACITLIIRVPLFDSFSWHGVSLAIVC